ncbi:MAG: hypothetical protein EOO44_11595 [Flavobacterium sp.]|nr:MAG: hypothetical protein EOO44_11595 [Flavobacterium sp.]
MSNQLKFNSFKIFKFNSLFFLFLTIIAMSVSSCGSDDAPESPEVTLPTTGTVIGTVSKENSTLSGAIVTLKQEGQTDKNITVEADGAFKFTSVPVGKITIVVTYPSYITQTKPLVVVGGQTTTLSIVMGGDPEVVTLIPDAAFEQIIINMGFDTAPVNGSVPTYQIKKITHLTLNDSGVADLTGLQDFTALESLSCSNLYGTSVIKLTTIDLSKNTALKSLNLGSNKIATLDISKNLALQSIEVSGNFLSTLNVSKHTALTKIFCADNPITSLDISNNVLLEQLAISQSSINNIDVSKNPALQYLYCNGSKLTTLDVTKNPSLKVLYCIDNELKTLDLSQNMGLTGLSCGKNEITNLDLTKNIALNNLSCSSNTMTSIDITKCTQLEMFSCSNNLLSNLDISQNTKLLYLHCSYNNLAVLDCSKNPLLSTKDGYYLICDNNVLGKLNLKDGNNINIKGGNFLNNPSFLQIAVDDVNYSNDKWKGMKDPAATYVSSF